MDLVMSPSYLILSLQIAAEVPAYRFACMIDFETISLRDCMKNSPREEAQDRRRLNRY
jgi:hypothetical protein